jgi:outer membrane protein assembly factor BamB
MLSAAIRLAPVAALLAIACDHDSTGPAESATPVVLSTGLDPSYPTLAASGSDRIFTVRLNDATTRLLDARNASGDIVWTATIEKCPNAPCIPAVGAAGNVYIVTTQGLKSLSSSGSLRWTAPGINYGRLAVGSNGLVYGLTEPFIGTQSLYAVDQATGATTWKVVLTLSDAGAILVDNLRSAVYAISRGKVIALDAANGSVKWTASPLLGANCFGGGDGAIAPDGTLYVPCDNDFSSRLSAYSPSGTAKWIKELGSTNGTLTPLIDASGTIYVANSGSVNAVNADGTIIWKFEGLTRNNVVPVIDSDKNVYIIAQKTPIPESSLMVIKDGELVENRGAINLGDYGALLLTQQGRIYYNSAGSLIYFQAKATDTSPWSQMSGDAGRTASRKIPSD